MRHDKRQLTAVVLAILLLTALFAPAAALRPVRAEDPYAEIERLKEEQAEIDAEKERLEYEIALFEDEEALLDSEYAWLAERSQEERERFEERVRQLMKVYTTMDAVKTSYEIAIQKYEAKKEQYGQRISAMFAMQQKSLLEIFLESRTIEGFFTTIRLMRIITAADEEALEDLKRSEENLEKQRKLAEDDFYQMEAIVDALNADLDAIETQVMEKEAEVWKVQQALIERADQMTSYNALSEELAQQQQEYELQARGMQYQNYGIVWSGSGFAHPCPNHAGITSTFGYRSIPSIGLNDFHTGLDFGAAPGTPVIAAAPGYVYFAAYAPVGGNTVRIDHGDGLTTSYCHLSGFNTFQGAVVQAGDVIGYVGSTGLSTGPHLHFEVQVYGTPVDPFNYLY